MCIKAGLYWNRDIVDAIAAQDSKARVAPRVHVLCRRNGHGVIVASDDLLEGDIRLFDDPHLPAIGSGGLNLKRNDANMRRSESSILLAHIQP